MDFEVLGEITDIEIIAVGTGIRDRVRLKKTYGIGRWRKLKGNATFKCYEAHGVGKREFKLKLPFLD